LRTLKQAYAKSPYLENYIGFIEKIFSHQYARVVDLDVEIIQYLMTALQIETRVVKLSRLGFEGRGTQLLTDICTRLQATQFVAQKGARKHLDQAWFERSEIQLKYFKVPTPIYPQLWGNFISNLSILDLLFNCGPKARDILLG
jgi:hypothetical protein